VTTDGLASPTPPTPAGPSRSHRVRNLLVIVAGFFVTLAVVVGGALYFLYERSVGIDRSTPQVVTRQFLNAALVLRDPDQVSLFVCSGWSATEAVALVNAPTDPRVVVSWGDTRATVTGDRATALVDVRFTVHDGTGLQEDVQTWLIELENEDGWRVCGLSKEPSLDP
jgi:hypothetical protein